MDGLNVWWKAAICHVQKVIWSSFFSGYVALRAQGCTKYLMTNSSMLCAQSITVRVTCLCDSWTAGADLMYCTRSWQRLWSQGQRWLSWRPWSRIMALSMHLWHSTIRYTHTLVYSHMYNKHSRIMMHWMNLWRCTTRHVNIPSFAYVHMHACI